VLGSGTLAKRKPIKVFSYVEEPRGVVYAVRRWRMALEFK
jgi:hypothetical protein